MIKESKKGQLALFIILVLVIVVGIVIFFVFREKIHLGQPSSEETRESALVGAEVESCTKNLLVDGVRLVGLQGGYFNPPAGSLITNFSSVAYGYYLGTNKLPTKTKIADEVSAYIKIMLPLCLDKIRLSNVNLSFGSTAIKTTINDNLVSTTVNLPITFTSEQKVYTLNKKYFGETKIRLGKIYNAAQNIVAKQIEDPSNLDMTYLSSLGFSVVLLPSGNNNLIYSISDKNSTVGQLPYGFTFAAKIK